MTQMYPNILLQHSFDLELIKEAFDGSSFDNRNGRVPSNSWKKKI